MTNRVEWRTIAIEDPRRKLPDDWFRCRHAVGQGCELCREERANFLGREHLLSLPTLEPPSVQVVDSVRNAPK